MRKTFFYVFFLFKDSYSIQYCLGVSVRIEIFEWWWYFVHTTSLSLCLLIILFYHLSYFCSKIIDLKSEFLCSESWDQANGIHWKLRSSNWETRLSTQKFAWMRTTCRQRRSNFCYITAWYNWWPGSPSSTFTHTSISNTNLFSYSEIQNIFALLNNYDWKHLRFQSYVGFTLVWRANSVNVLNFSILRGIYLSLACHLFKCTNFNLTWGLL